MSQTITKDNIEEIINQYHDFRLKWQMVYPEKIIEFNKSLKNKGLGISQNSFQVIYNDTSLVPKAYRVFNLGPKLITEEEIFKTILEDSTKLLTKNMFFVINRTINHEEYKSLLNTMYHLNGLDFNITDLIGINEQSLYSSREDKSLFENRMIGYNYYVNDKIDSKLEYVEDLYHFTNRELNLSQEEFKTIMKNEIMNEKLKENYPFLSSRDALRISERVIDLQDNQQEEFVVVSFREGKICDINSLFKGGSNKATIDYLVIMNHLSECRADGFICFHNHPSGSVNPSKADLSMTKTLNTFANKFGITCIDHFIIAQGKLTTNLGEMNNLKAYEHKIEKNKVINELFPNDNFRKAILETVFNQSKESDNLNIYANQLDAIKGQKQLLISNYGIENLKGIEFFESLERLDVSLNPIRELNGLCDDINTIYAHNTNLTELRNEDIPSSIELLDVSFSKLNSLDVSKCKNLKSLFCSFNNISNLDLDGCDNLSCLFTEDNNLSHLVVENLPILEQLECSNNHLTKLDLPHTITWLACNHNQISELSLNHCEDLERLECESNNLIRLEVDYLKNLRIIRCGDNKKSSHELINKLDNKDQIATNLEFSR